MSRATPERTKAILIGIERYAAGSEWDLNGPVNDVVRFATLLRARGVPRDNIRCYVEPLRRPGKDEQVGKAREIAAVCDRPTKGVLLQLFEDQLPDEECDCLILYWSGHGFMEPFGRQRRLFTADATARNYHNISLTGLLEFLRTDIFPNIGRVDAIVDACANQMDESRIPKPDFASGKMLAKDWGLLCAASEGEFAQNLTAEQTNLFTKELLALMEAGDARLVSPLDLPDVARAVTARIKQLGPGHAIEQKPSLVWWKVGDEPETLAPLERDDKRAAFLTRLGVFPGSFSFLACKAVCPDFDEVELLFLLDRLLEAGLVRRVPRLPQGAPRLPHRYILRASTLRSARDNLEASGRKEATCRLHATFFCELAEKHECGLRSAGRRASIAVIEEERVNIMAALAWCGQAGDSLELGLRLAGALGWYWICQGYFDDGRAQLRPLLEKDGSRAASPGRARALYADGALAFMMGEYDTARRRLNRAAEMIETEPAGLDRNCRLALTLTVLARARRDFAEGAKIARRARQLATPGHHKWAHALVLNDLGYVLASDRKWPEAIESLTKSCSLWRELGDNWGLPLSLNNLGMVYLRNNRLGDAREVHREALGLYLNDGNDWGVAESLKFLGEVEFADLTFSEAEMCFRESLRRLQRNPRIQLKVDCMLGLAKLKAAGDPALAARLLAAWKSENVRLDLVKPPLHWNEAHRLESKLIGQLGERFTREWELGRDSDVDTLLEPWLLPVGAPPAGTDEAGKSGDADRAR